jgi:hypothetical protein
MSTSISSLASLLSGGDPTSRTRIITLLSSLLVTRPTSILNQFSDFLPFFLSLLAPTARTSPTFSSMCYLLYRSIKSQHSNISRTAVLPILQYLAAFLDSPDSTPHANSFSFALFDARKYLKLVKLLASQGLDDSHFPAMLRILAVTRRRDPEGRFLGGLCALLQPSASRIAGTVLRSPSDTLPYLIRILWTVTQGTPGAADRQPVPELASQILHCAIVGENSRTVKRLCFPYIAKIKTHPLYNGGALLQAVYSEVLGALQEEQFEPEADPAPFSLLAGVANEHAMFGKTRPTFLEAVSRRSSANKLPTATEPLPEGLPGLIDADVALKTPVEKPAPQQQAPIVPVPDRGRSRTYAMMPRKPVEKVVEQPPPKLVALGMAKSTGKFAGPARKRLFEFSTINRSLVWRNEKEKEIIKGGLFFDAATKVERSGAVLVVKGGGKPIQIQFDNDRIAGEWAAAMAKVCAAAGK